MLVVDYGVTGRCFGSGDLGYADQFIMLSLVSGSQKCVPNAGYTWVVVAYQNSPLYPWVSMYVTSEYRPILFIQ